MEGPRRVNLFSYILGYSRRQYIHFTASMDFETTIREHIKAFEHLGGVAAVCLYDNMKVVVTRWEDDAPVYNTRLLAFATHYGYRPWACQVRRPQTKGKVERPFHYVEMNLLGGREFRSLEHLNEVARWWLAQVADVRVHGTTKKTPLELHAKNSRICYRCLRWRSIPRKSSTGSSIPTARFSMRTIVTPFPGDWLASRCRCESPKNISWSTTARLRKSLGTCCCRDSRDKRRIDPAHAPPRDHEEQMQRLRERFAELGEVGVAYLEGLESKQRNSKHQAIKVLGLLHAYHKSDVLRAMERGVQYHAYGFSSLERILAHQATPKPAWQQLDEGTQETLQRLADDEPVGPRHSQEYQDLLYGNCPPTNEPHEQTEQTAGGEAVDKASDRADTPRVDPAASGDPEDPAQR